MDTARKLKIYIGIYVGVLTGLLLCVCATPMLIQAGVSTSPGLMIEEEVLETSLIVTLFALSCLILRKLLGTLNAYRQTADQVAEENATLMSRLADAFKYIGTVNVEIQEIQSVLNGLNCYPQSKKEFRRCLDGLAAKAMAVTGAPWSVIRLIDHRCCRTIKECAAERCKGALPTVTMGNRDILEGRRIRGLTAIARHPDSPEFSSVCIFPDRPLAEAEHLLLVSILGQFEMLFLLYRSGGFQLPAKHAVSVKTA